MRALHHGGLKPAQANIIKVFAEGLAVVERKTIGIVLAVGLAGLVGKGMIDSHYNPSVKASSNSHVAQVQPSPVQTTPASEVTKAEDSEFNHDLSHAHSSRDLSKADLAWHALNTYGWDCSEVVSEQQPPKEKYSVITCSSGLKLRVYRRSDAHPLIRNIKGGYD